MADRSYVLFAPRPGGTILEHDSDACGLCQYVGHQDFIRVTPRQREQATVTIGKIIRWQWCLGDPEDAVVELGFFSMPGLRFHEKFYLVECYNCHRQYVDYAHGHELYLHCPHCKSKTILENERFYRERGLSKPPGALSHMIHAFKALRAAGRSQA